MGKELKGAGRQANRPVRELLLSPGETGTVTGLGQVLRIEPHGGADGGEVKRRVKGNACVLA